MTPKTSANHSLHESYDEKSLDKIENGGAVPQQNVGAAPDGGLQAWTVVIGAAFVIFCSMGYVNSFGVFQEYYMTHQLRDKSPDDIAWIGSISTFLQFFMGSLAGPLFDRYGVVVIWPAAVIFLFSMMMLSLCYEYWHFMLAQGVLMGISMGFMVFPAMGAVSQFFHKKRAAAIGCAVPGSSIGGVIFPIAISKMLNDSTLSFGWSIRVVGFIMVPLLAFACLAIKTRLPSRTTNFFVGAAFKELHYVLLVLSQFFLLFGMFTPLFYLPSYAVSRGVDNTLASYLLAILNGASTFGRIIPGILADKFGRLNMLAAGGFTTAIVIFCFNSPTTIAGFVVYSIVVGFASGTIVSGGTAAFTVCAKDPRDIGTYMGMGIGISSIAALVSPPANGALLTNYGGFFQIAMFSGALCTVGALFALASKAATPEGILARR